MAVFEQLQKDCKLANKPNWASFASSFKYLHHFPIFYQMHLTLGNDSETTITEFNRLQEKYSDDDDNVDTAKVLEKVYNTYKAVAKPATLAK